MKQIIKLTLLIFIILSPLSTAYSIDIPENSYAMGNRWYCSEGFKRQGNSCLKINVPKNAYVMSNRWYCSEGFKQQGNSCMKLNVPRNAYVMGNRWYCSEGFKRQGNSCMKLNVPKDAYVMGNRWYCSEGFKRQGNSCMKLNVPKNAYVMGNRWYCSEGFKRQGNNCQKLDVPKNAYVMGNRWYCSEGFKKQGNNCLELGSLASNGQYKKERLQSNINKRQKIVAVDRTKEHLRNNKAKERKSNQQISNSKRIVLTPSTNKSYTSNTYNTNNADIVSTLYKQSKYYCQNLTSSEAQALYTAGHTYLDADSDGLPCEWEEKTSYSYTPRIKAYTAPTYTGNCHFVSGYTKRNGTYVSGYTRCR